MVDSTWINGPIYGIRTLMANSAAFRTAVGAADVAAAKAVIYPWGAYNEQYGDSNPAQPPPRVILRYDECLAIKRGPAHWNTGYAVYADFEFTPTSDEDQAAAESLLNTVQTVVNEMLALEGTSGYIIIDEIETDISVQISDPDESNDGQRYIRFGVFFKELSRVD